MTGKLVAKAFLKRSSLSRNLAEPEHFGRCAFTNAEVLKSELAVSELSGKPYLAFEQMRSAASGKTGHKSEFITCYETREPLGRVEAETCQSTGNLVRPGVLQNCAVTHKRVLPSELDRCAVTHKRALKNLFVKSSISHMTMLEEAAIRSAAGKYCMPSEAQICSWSERRFHPDDLQTCSLVGLTVHFSFLTDTGQPRLKPLVEMLDGNRKNADGVQVWPSAATRLAEVRKVGKCRVEAATKSPSDHLLAMSCETKALLGLRIHQLGAVFDIRRNDFVGRVVDGKRRPTGWTQS